MRGPAVRALASYDHPKTPKAVLEAYDSFPESVKRDALKTLTSRPSYAMALLGAIEAGEVPRDHLSAVVVRRMANLDSEKVRSRLEAVWGKVRTPSEAKQARIKKYKKLLTEEALKKADPSKGRVLFEKTCGGCHTLFGKGGNIGPTLTGANRGSVDYLLRNIVDPSAVVGRDYQLSIFQTKDGRVVSGTVVSETEDAVTVRTTNDRVVLAKEKIKKKQRLEQSLMPEGLLQNMSQEEVRDLFAYLQSPKQVPLPEKQ